MLSISENEVVGLVRVISVHQMRRLNYKCVAGEVRDDVIQDVYLHLYEKKVFDSFDVGKMDSGDSEVGKLSIYLSVVVRRFLINRMHKLDNKILFSQRSLDRSIIDGEAETYKDSVDSGIDVESQVIDSIGIERDDRNSKVCEAFRKLKSMPHKSVGKRDRCLPTMSWFDMLRAFVSGKSDKELGSELGYKADTIKLRRSRIGAFIFNQVSRGDLVSSDSGVW